MDKQMAELKEQNRHTAMAATRATQESQRASRQSAEAQQGIKKIASKTNIHGQVLPKIASQIGLDEETSRLLGDVGSSSQG